MGDLKRLPMWKGLFGDAVAGIHEFIVEPVGEFEGGSFSAKKLKPNIGKVVGKHKQGGMRTHAYGFAVTEFTPQQARDWLRRYARGLAGRAIHRKLAFAMNYRFEMDENTGLVTLYEVEIMAAGEWNGRFYSIEDLAKIVEDSNAIHELVRPVFKIGHGEEQPAYGWISTLRVLNDKIIADRISAIPAWLFGEIDQGRYSRLSPEVLVNYTEPSTQTTYPRILAAVAVLGVQIPAMTNLKPLSEFKEIHGDREYPAMDSDGDKDYNEADFEAARYTLLAFSAEAPARDGTPKPEPPDEKPETDGGGKVADEKKDALEAAEAKLKADRESFQADMRAGRERVIRDRVAVAAKAGKFRTDENVEAIVATAMAMDPQAKIAYKRDGKEIEVSAVDHYLSAFLERETNAHDTGKAPDAGKATEKKDEPPEIAKDQLYEEALAYCRERQWDENDYEKLTEATRQVELKHRNSGDGLMEKYNEQKSSVQKADMGDTERSRFVTSS